ncbi:MAG: prolipoprotein diacylglyceryl transferase [Clostridiales bacterium]|nr:prolipoprotein diacylglyceryl transferase [Clostridiales bacterium]
MNSYYLWMLLSALVCTALYAVLARKLKHSVALALLTLALGAALGTVFAKLVYYLTQIDFMIANGWLQSLVNPDPAEWCFFGGAIGVALGAFLAARVLRVKPSAALDAFAPAGALMVALARFSGYFLRGDMIGLGEYMEEPALCFFPLTVVNEWDEHYLAVFMLEGLCALVVMALSLRCFKTRRFVRTVFYLCLPQIICESLHSDSISWLFVRVEQLLSMITMAAIMLLYMRWMHPCRTRWMPIVICVVCAGLFVGVEFALDKTEWPILAIYSAMLLGLVAMAIMETRFFRKLKT